MVEERFLAVTPWRRTSSGRVGSAACTRLSTLIVARSGSVPMAKVIVIDSDPVPELAERM